MGVHQRIDRVAFRHVSRKLPAGVVLPTVREILHFEGLNGPDGIKRKSPAKDEPWHYIDPKNDQDRNVVDMMLDHITNMTAALASDNPKRVAFEAAWLAHAIVDSLTPAHHYPLEAKLEELRGGQGLETRVTAKDKLLLPGINRRHQLHNNWQYWGAKGVMTTHLGFELGVATTIAGHGFDDSMPSDDDFKRIETEGFELVYWDILHKVDGMGMYEEYTRLGWTRHLATETKKTLLPEIIKAVTLAWYQAVVNIEKSK